MRMNNSVLQTHALHCPCSMKPCKSERNTPKIHKIWGETSQQNEDVRYSDMNFIRLIFIKIGPQNQQWERDRAKFKMSKVHIKHKSHPNNCVPVSIVHCNNHDWKPVGNILATYYWERKCKWRSKKILFVRTARSNDSYLKWKKIHRTDESDKNATASLLVEVFFMLLARIFNSPLFCEQSRMEQINLQFHL